MPHNASHATHLPSLSDIAYRQVRDAILSGAYSAGQSLGQEEIASQIGTSRVPLREALQRLEAEGLVMLRPRRGYIVTSLDPEEIQDIFDIRMMLEERAGYLATLRATDVDIAEVEAHLHAMDALKITNAEEASFFAERNSAFHDRLYLGSGRAQLCRLMVVLRTNVDRYIRIGAQFAGNLDRTRADHHEIFRAFKRRDAQTVGRLCREHCAATCERLIGHLVQQSSKQVTKVSAKKEAGKNAITGAKMPPAGG